MKLCVENVSKRFGSKLAVDHVDAELSEGVYGFLGANGAGKTTLMQIICGIVRPTEGQIMLDGRNHIKMGEEFRDLLGYLPQEFGYTPRFTAKEFLLYVASVKGLVPEYAKKRTKELLELVNLSDEANRKIKTFSGGMKRRLGIAQALLNDPKLLILDEPTSGLDPQERAYFRNIISDLSKNRIILLSTHIVSDVEYIADQILIMKQGKFILNGTPKELVSHLNDSVWELTITEKEWNWFQETFCVVNTHFHDQVVDARIISESRPAKGARQAEATLEDLYLKCFEQKRENAGKWEK